MTTSDVVKTTIGVKDATKICRDALFKYVSDLGFEDITCELWFLNCKRKGIVFKGKRIDNNKRVETGNSQSKGIQESKYVSKDKK